MELRTFTAPSMSEALAQVKAALGRDAVILHTRSVRRRRIFGLASRSLVEITATADEALVEICRALVRRAGHVGAGRPDERGADTQRLAGSLPRGPARGERPSAAGNATGGADESVARELSAIRSMVESLMRSARPPSPDPSAAAGDLPAELIEYYARLIGQQVTDEIARELLRDVPAASGGAVRRDQNGRAASGGVALDEGVRQALVRRIESMLGPAEPVALTAEGRPTVVALVGPTGVGKTTTIAKLAAHMKLREKKSVGLMTIDSYRIGAIEQLRTYALIMQIPIVAVAAPQEVRSALEELADREIIFIDTAGRSQRDDVHVAELKEFLDAASPDQVHLVLSSATGEAVMREAVERFSKLGARQLILTKLDEAVGYGVILNLARSVEMRLSYLTGGQSVPDDIEPASASRVARLILGEAAPATGPAGGG